MVRIGSVPVLVAENLRNDGWKPEDDSSGPSHVHNLQRTEEPVNGYSAACLKHISLIDDSKVSTPHYLVRLLRELRIARHVTHPYIARLLHSVPAPNVESFGHA